MPDKRIFAIIALIFFPVLACLIFLAPDGYGGADSFQHYLISRYSWKHHELLLDHWGKPVFTLLSSPFSQLGYKGLLLFNVLVTLTSSFVVFKISSKLENVNAAFGALFYLLMPMVLLTAVSALTEPLFAFLLVCAVWLFSEKKYFIAIVLLSFLPLVRSEGFVVFPVFALALLLEGKWKYLPLFITGILTYSYIGYIAFGDFLWLINRSPYTMGAGIYGSGPWYHFIVNAWYIFGVPLALLLVLGLYFYFPRTIKWLKEEHNILRILIAGSFAAYFLSHAYVWWKGTGGSLGLERVIAGVCPLAAIIALSGYNKIKHLLKKLTISSLWFTIPFFLAVGKSYYSVGRGNLSQGTEQQVMQRAADWITAQPALATQKFYYYNPHIAFLLNKDVFDENEVKQLWGLIDEQDPLLWLQDGQFLVWDAHFGSNEGHTTIEQLLHKQNVKILKRFHPDDQTPVLGGYNYEVIVLGKQTGWKDTLIAIIPDSNSAFAQLGSKDFSLGKENEFADVFEENMDNYPASEVVYMDITIRYPADITLEKDKLVLILEMHCGTHNLIYNTTDLSAAEVIGSEKVITKHHLLPPLIKGCSTLKSYFWNLGKTDIHGAKVEVKLVYVPENPS